MRVTHTRRRRGRATSSVSVVGSVLPVEHVNEVYNPFLGNVAKALSLLKPKSIYMGDPWRSSSRTDANDPNLVFSCELPQATSGSSLISNKSNDKDSNAHIVRTRVILNPPNHSKIATEFTLVPGFLNRSDIARFHRPCFPNRQIEMNVRTAGMLRRSAPGWRPRRTLANTAS